jgi:hypothetical protein
MRCRTAITLSVVAQVAIPDIETLRRYVVVDVRIAQRTREIATRSVSDVEIISARGGVVIAHDLPSDPSVATNGAMRGSERGH